MGKLQIVGVLAVLWLARGLLSSAQAQRQAVDRFPLPELEVISPENAERVQYLGNLEGFSDWTVDAAFSPDGRTVAATGFYSDARIWDAQTGRLIGTIDCPADDGGGWTGGVTFSPDGTWIAVACGTSVQLWDATHLAQANEMQPIRVLHSSSAHVALLEKVVVNRQGTLLAADGDTEGSSRAVWLWNIETNTAIAVFKGDELCCPNFSPDGKLLAYVDGETTHLVDTETLEETSILDVRSEVFSLDWSLSAGVDTDVYHGYPQRTVIRLWSVEADSPAKLLHNQVAALAFSPDRRLLASGSEGFYVNLWDTRTFEKLAVIPTGGISSLAFSPDGKLIVTTHAASGEVFAKVLLWGVPSRESTSNGAS